MTLKWLLGMISFSGGLISITLNLLIVFPVLRLAFVSRRSSIYIIASFNIISDLCQLSVTCLYLSGSIMANRYLLTEDRTSFLSILLGGFFISAWNMESLVQIVMAVNRFTVISLRQKGIFTFHTTIIIFAFILTLTIFSAICVQYLFPCCIFVADHNLMSYTYIEIEGVYNFSNSMLAANDFFCTCTSTLCYVFVFNTIRKSTLRTPQNVQSTRGNQDVKYLLQFLFTSIFYIFTWVLFEILPHIVPADQTEWFAVVPILIILNCSSNSIIYLSTNPEVKKSLKLPFLSNKRGGKGKIILVSAVDTNRTNNFISV